MGAVAWWRGGGRPVAVFGSGRGRLPLAAKESLPVVIVGTAGAETEIDGASGGLIVGMDGCEPGRFMVGIIGRESGTLMVGTDGLESGKLILGIGGADSERFMVGTEIFGTIFTSTDGVSGT